MKIKNAFTYITVLALGALLAPLAAFASTPTGMPTFSATGVGSVTTFGARVYVIFDQNNASYDSNHRPLLGVSYTNTQTGETGVTDLNPQPMSGGVNQTKFDLYKLSPGTKYSYRVIMNYNGTTYSTSDQWFVTKSSYASSSTSSASSSSSVSTTTPSGGGVVATSTTSSSSTTSSGGIINVLSSATGDSVATSVKNKVFTAGSVHKNGVALLITDEQARVNRLDTITYTIKYQNTRSTSLKDAEINIQLPKQYEFIKSSIDGDYDADHNIVTFSIGRIAPDTLKSFTMTARAIGEGNQEVETTATLTYEGGSLSATDRTEYSSGSKSVLGASVFGAGFFPQTLGGWVLVIILIAVLVIVARRYMTAPVQPAQPQTTA